MPTKHRSKVRVPLDMEPSLHNQIEDISSQRCIPRTKLLRILVKYATKDEDTLNLAIKHGDKK